jgi:hypothetical protein
MPKDESSPKPKEKPTINVGDDEGSDWKKSIFPKLNSRKKRDKFNINCLSIKKKS